MHSTLGTVRISDKTRASVKCGFLEQSLHQHLHQKEKENIREERFETGHKKDLGGQPKGVRKVNCLGLAELQ